MIRRFRIGSTVEMAVIRDGKPMKIPVELVAVPVPTRQMEKFKDEIFEFTARDVAFEDRAREKWEKKTRGVYVEAVEPGGWAALAHMAVGDLLLSCAGRAVGNVADMEKVAKMLVKESPKHVVFHVRRGIHTLYLEVEPDWGRSK